MQQFLSLFLKREEKKLLPKINRYILFKYNRYILWKQEDSSVFFYLSYLLLGYLDIFIGKQEKYSY